MAIDFDRGPACARCGGKPYHAANEDCAEYVNLLELPEVVRAMESLKPGSLVDMQGKPVPDTLESRASMFRMVFEAEMDHVRQLEDMLKAERGLPIKLLQGWTWVPDHLRWQKRKLWVERKAHWTGWTYGIGGDDSSARGESDLAWYGMFEAEKLTAKT